MIVAILNFELTEDDRFEGVIYDLLRFGGNPLHMNKNGLTVFDFIVNQVLMEPAVKGALDIINDFMEENGIESPLANTGNVNPEDVLN